MDSQFVHLQYTGAPLLMDVQYSEILCDVLYKYM